MSIDDVRSYRDQGLLQPPRRQRSRTDDFAFQAEHVERLQFIKRALTCGFSLDDVAKIVDSTALVTCGDMRALTDRRLQQLREAGCADSPAAANLQRLRETCSAVGPRRDCSIIEALSNPEC
jgi:DNA-binding transcriptional MerR regulator